MSPELETLDQLIGGALPLQAVYRLFPDGSRFTSGLLGLLQSGKVRLVAEDGAELPHWQWRETLTAPNTWPPIRVGLSLAGTTRIE